MSDDMTKHQLAMLRRARPSLVDQLTPSERLQLGAEMEKVAEWLIESRPSSHAATAFLDGRGQQRPHDPS